MNNKLKYYLISITFLVLGNLCAQPNFEVINPLNCETGSCSVNFSGPTEAGLNEDVTITIRNNSGFGGNLTGTLSLIPFFGCTDCSSCPDQCLYYSILSSTTINLPTNTDQTITIRFNPTFDATVGPIPIKLRVTINNDDAAGTPIYTDADITTPELDVDININGEVKKTVINYSIVMDRSGSMAYMEGANRRIDLLADAVDFFLSLEQLRRQDLPQFDGDSIGMVRYDHEVDATYLPLSVVTDDLINLTAKPLVDVSATNDINQIMPRGSTATGNAVIAGINEHFPDAAPTPRKKVMILFSDGFENTGPLVGDPAVTSLLAARQDVNIYSIGMGSANLASLQQYSSLSGLSSPQLFEVDATSFDPLQLTNFFFKIYQNAIGLESIIDPTYYVNLNDSVPTNIANAWLTSSDIKVIFSITHPRDFGDWANFQLISPSGKVLSAGLNDGIDTKIIEGRNHVIYEINVDETAETIDYVGNWILKGIALKTTKNQEHTQSSVPEFNNVPIGFAVATLSNLSLDLDAGTQENEPGEELVVTSEIEDSSSDEEVQVDDFVVTITRPDGKEIRLRPTKDRFGTFVARYPHTQKKGTYKVYAKATLRNSKGEVTTRDVMKHVVVSNQQSFTSTSVEEPCLSCYYIKVIIVVAFIALMIIFIAVLRRNRP